MISLRQSLNNVHVRGSTVRGAGHDPELVQYKISPVFSVLKRLETSHNVLREFYP